MRLIGRPGRKAVLKTWRQRRIDTDTVQDFTAEDDMAPAVRVRPRRRAPTPKLLPTLLEIAVMARTQPRRLAAGLGGAALLVLALFVAVAPRFRVQWATVSGNGRVPAEAIFAASGIQGRHILRVDRQEAAHAIERLDDIAQAEVGLGWAGRAWIQVVETRPVLLWQGPAKAMAVDEKGRAIALPSDATSSSSVAMNTGLVAVRDMTSFGVLNQVGDRLPQGVVEAAQALSPSFPRLAFSPDLGFVTTTDQGWEVRLGLVTDPKRVAGQQATLKALSAQLAADGADVAYIDLRPIERPFYRLRGEAGS